MPTFSWRGNWISAAASWAHQWNLRNCCLEAARTRAKAHRTVWKVHLNIDNVCVFSIYKPLQYKPTQLQTHFDLTKASQCGIQRQSGSFRKINAILSRAVRLQGTWSFVVRMIQWQVFIQPNQLLRRLGHTLLLSCDVHNMTYMYYVF